MKRRKVFKAILVRPKNLASESLSLEAFKPQVADTNKKKYNRKKIEDEKDSSS